MSKLLILGVSNNRRVSMMIDAWQKCAGDQVKVLNWLDFLNDSSLLDPLLEWADVFKIESAGEDWEVEKKLILRGAQNQQISELSSQLSFDRGLIRHQRLWYAGWCATLDLLESLVARHSIKVMNSPQSLKLLFDKLAWHQHIAIPNGITMPKNLGQIDSFDDFLEKSGGKGKFFIKPAHSSSASGVLAIQLNRDKILIKAPIERVSERIYNTLKINTITDWKEAEWLINRLSEENIFAEKWFRKANVPNERERVFDLRVVTTSGKANHAVMRTSRSPITNLHLGNARGDVLALKEKMQEEGVWENVIQIAEKTAASQPDELYLGIDVMVGQNLHSTSVAEVNGFGDLLPNVLDANGRNTYEAQAYEFC